MQAVVLKHLSTVGSISIREAMDDYSVSGGSLTKTVCRLKAKGHNIVKEWRRHPISNRRYARYYLSDVFVPEQASPVVELKAKLEGAPSRDHGSADLPGVAEAKPIPFAKGDMLIVTGNNPDGNGANGLGYRHYHEIDTVVSVKEVDETDNSYYVYDAKQNLCQWVSARHLVAYKAALPAPVGLGNLNTFRL